MHKKPKYSSDRQLEQKQILLVNVYNKLSINFSKCMIVICIFVVFLIVPLSHEQCCTKFVTGSKKCAECPTGFHLVKGSCIFDVDNCDTYVDGFDCSKCKTNYTLTSGACVLIPPPPPPPPTPPANTTPPTSSTQQVYGDLEKDDNLAILVDYSRSIQKDLQTGTPLYGLVRKFPNGTEYTVVQIQAKGPKYYQVVAEFDKKIVGILKLIGIKELGKIPSPPSKTPPTTPPTPDPKPDNPSNSTVIPKPDPKPDINQPVIPIPSGFKVLTASERSKDKGYLAVEALQKSVTTDKIGNAPNVLASFFQVVGLNAEYRIFFQSTDKKSIYEGRSIYQAARDKVFNVSFTKTTLR